MWWTGVERIQLAQGRVKYLISVNKKTCDISKTVKKDYCLLRYDAVYFVNIYESFGGTCFVNFQGSHQRWNSRMLRNYIYISSIKIQGVALDCKHCSKLCNSM